MALTRVQSSMISTSQPTPNFVGLDSTWAQNNTDDANAESSIGNWVTYQDAAATSPVDMTGGVANTAISRTTTAGELINGTGSFKLVKSSGASRQGEGASVTFNVPPSYQGKACSINIPFKVTSGSIVSGDFKVFIYDVTNSVLITPFNNDIVGSSGTIKASFFTTPSATTPANQQYRIGIHVASATDSTVNICFDDVTVAPISLAYAGAMSDWQNFPSTAAGTLITGTSSNPAYGTVTENIARWRRVGDSMEIQWSYKQSSGGSAGSGTYLFNLPSGYVIDTTVTGTNSSADNHRSLVGEFHLTDTDNTAIGSGGARVWSSTQIYFDTFLATVGGSANAATAWGSAYNRNFSSFANLAFGATIKVPIVGWTSSNPVTTSQQIRISSYLGTGTRVTGAAPANLGEYRSYLRNVNANTYTETNGSPTTAPTVGDGVLIYRNTAWGTVNTNNQPSKYDIFVGKNKQIKWLFYSAAGFTGNADVTPFAFSSTVMQGYATSYDPTTGVATILAPTDSTKTTASNTAFDSTGAAITSNIYFDIIVSEQINSVALVAAGAPMTVDTPQTTSFTARINFFHKLSGSGGALTVTLPDATGLGGQRVFLHRTDDTPTNTVTITPSNSQTIDGASGSIHMFTKNEKWVLVSDNTNWVVESHTTRTDRLGSATITFSSTGATQAAVGTTTTNNITYERIGRYARIYLQLVQTGAGTTGNGETLITLPAGLTADTTIVPVNSNTTFAAAVVGGNLMGQLWTNNGAGGNVAWYFPHLHSSTKMGFGGSGNAAGGLVWGDGGTASMGLGNTTLNVNGWIDVPIVNWEP